MPEPAPLAERLRRPLVWAIGAVLAVGSLSALVVDPAPGRRHADRPETAGLDGAPVPTDAGAGPDGQQMGPEVVVDAGGAAGGVGGQGGAGGGDGSPAPAPVPLGPSAVPAPGTYRYEVRTTDAGGDAVVQEELREVVLITGDRRAGTVQVSARLAGESQVSVLDWSPAGALVRSTRVESAGGGGRDCAWEPPFPELGALGPGERWTVDSSCRATVAGMDTVFRVTGSGLVVGEATVDFAGQQLRVWEVRRDRTTTIEADIDGSTRRQDVREVGTILFDPRRGVVVRADVTVTLAGTREGESRRVSVLQP